MTTISMCMIVKNEEAFLQRCLDSYAPIYDELIIVDTGSTDRTKEIASQYTNFIYDFCWCDDFSAARNYAFSKASCDYIFSADADEVLDACNLQAFLDLKAVLLPEIEIVQMKYVNAVTHNDVYNARKEYRPKLFKRLRTFTWISPIHETIRLNPVVFDSDIEILHMPAKSHNKRDFSTFIKAFQKGVCLDDYVILMFCKELFISGSDEDFLLVQDIFENTLACEDRSFDCAQNIRCVLARIYRLLGNKDAFFQLCMTDPSSNFCAEICMELGLNFYTLGKYEDAIYWFTKAYTEAESIIDIRTSSFLPLTYLAKCYTFLKETAALHHDSKTASHYEQCALSYQQQADQWQYPEEL